MQFGPCEWPRLSVSENLGIDLEARLLRNLAFAPADRGGL